MIATFKHLVARHWPVLRFRSIIFATLLLVAALPGIGAVFLRVYENALVRRTEGELVAQSAALAASAAVVWPGASEQAAPMDVQFEEPVTEVDLQSATVLPERPAPIISRVPVNPDAAAVLQKLKPVIAQTKAVTLASIQLLDRNAIVLNGYGAGGSLINAAEVATALRGQPTTVLRQNASYRQTYPLEWLSRASSLRLHHARPVRVDGKVVGVVLVSRSPRALFKGIYEDRGKIALGVIFIFGALVLISAILVRALVRPIENLSNATRTMATGRAITLQRPSLQVVEIRALFDDFEKMAEAIAQRSRYLRDFAAALSHEFKTPLASISGAIELLEDHVDTMSESDRNQFLGNIATDADRLSRLVRRMMELAKADMQLPDGTERIDVVPILAKIADSYRSSLFNVEVQAGCDSSGALIDPLSLETIAATLVENSRQAGATKVLIDTKYVDGRITIGFEDDGSGVPASDCERLFEPFFTSKRHAGGTGMGLSIARSLAEAHGGTLGLAHSSRGARFELALVSG